MSFNYFDGIVVAVIILSAILAYSRGFVCEVMAIGGWIVAALVAYTFAPQAAPLINEVPYVDKMIQVGPEAAVVFGPFSLQGEYHWTTVERTAGLGDADLEGGYVFASWFVTGQSRPYNAKKGTFGRVKAENAIELAARYSTVDLSEASAAATNGEEDNYTLGANYYFNPNVRLMLNYIHAEVDRVAAGTDEDIDAVVSRIQLDF